MRHQPPVSVHALFDVGEIAALDERRPTRDIDLAALQLDRALDSVTEAIVALAGTAGIDADSIDAWLNPVEPITPPVAAMPRRCASESVRALSQVPFTPPCETTTGLRAIASTSSIADGERCARSAAMPSSSMRAIARRPSPSSATSAPSRTVTR